MEGSFPNPLYSLKHQNLRFSGLNFEKTKKKIKKIGQIFPLQTFSKY